MTTTHTTLATRFDTRTVRVDRSHEPLTDDRLRAAAPSIFAAGKHVNRSERYTYSPTIEVLRGLRKEGFEPFIVAQGASRISGMAEFSKHLIRMRHAGHVHAKPEVNEIILINSHDGASSYPMLAGMFRLICCNDLAVGDVIDDIRIPHKDNIQGEVIECAFRVLDEFQAVEEHAEGMKALQQERGGQLAFATPALVPRFGERVIEQGGHRGVKLLISDRHEGIKADAAKTLKATWQRCRVQIMRNALSYANETARHMIERDHRHGVCAGDA